MKSGSLVTRKPKALREGSTIAWFAPASPPTDGRAPDVGLEELRQLGFNVVEAHELQPSGYFAASADLRAKGLLNALRDDKIDGLIALRGGYGSTYLLDFLSSASLGLPKCLIGYSDVTALQTFLWQRDEWVTFQGPMLLSGFDHGENGLSKFDQESFLNAVRNTTKNWSVNLQAETLVPGLAEGKTLGGCLTILQTSLGTPWEIDTDGAILLLEDTHMKPYQVDRALMHLKQAGKFQKIRGIILGDFPCCEPTVSGSPTVRWVCEQILGSLGLPIVIGAPIGHTQRPILTVPLGVQARLSAKGEGSLEFLEPAVVD